MTTAKTCVLQTEKLSRVVADTTLVADVSIQVQCGEVIAIVGPSGAGKSSLLRLLNRLDEPTSGSVFLDGQDYRNIPPQELRRKVGMVLQSPFLFPGSVADNVRFGPLQRGSTLPDERIAQLLNQVGLDGYAERDVHTLSGGEAQRVSLVRTLANEPEVLLCDEPTSSLDDASERYVETLIASIVHQQNIACLMITHDTDQALRIADRFLLFEQGKLSKSGSIAELSAEKGRGNA